MVDATAKLRLDFLARIVAKELKHLRHTDAQLFHEPMTAARMADLVSDPDKAERLDAFVSRFGRLQDTLGDKLLPAILAAQGERPGPAVDNLDKAERYGWVDSADQWLAIRKLRNQMVHEYIEDVQLLVNALTAGHKYVPMLAKVAEKFGAIVAKLENT